MRLKGWGSLSFAQSLCFSRVGGGRYPYLLPNPSVLRLWLGPVPLPSLCPRLPRGPSWGLDLFFPPPPGLSEK